MAVLIPTAGEDDSLELMYEEKETEELLRSTMLRDATARCVVVLLFATGTKDLVRSCTQQDKSRQ